MIQSSKILSISANVSRRWGCSGEWAKTGAPSQESIHGLRGLGHSEYIYKVY